MTSEQTSLKAIAELIYNEISPKPGSFEKIDYEDVLEKTRNAYSGILWQLYMAGLSDSDRAFHSVIATTGKIQVKEDATEVVMEGYQVVDVPNDAGMHMVIPSGTHCETSGVPLVRSSATGAYRTKTRIKMPRRYYRIGNELHFPDGLPCGTESLTILFYGVLEKAEEEMRVSRTIADMVHTAVKKDYMASVEVRSDVTPNKNPNE